jgi:hypothetical protein
MVALCPGCRSLEIGALTMRSMGTDIITVIKCYRVNTPDEKVSWPFPVCWQGTGGGSLTPSFVLAHQSNSCHMPSKSSFTLLLCCADPSAPV